MPTQCEVCGSCTASRTLVLCQTCKPGCQAGCHSFCLPGPQHSISTIQLNFTCLACSEAGDAHTRPIMANSRHQHTTARCAACAPAAKADGPIGAPRAQSPRAVSAHKQGRATVQWSLLPEEVLAAVLQHIDLPERLGSCALVSAAWAAAAVAATASISFRRSSAAALQDAWAACAPRYAAQLTHLSLATGHTRVRDSYSDMAAWNPCILHLPCTHLRALEVAGASVLLKAGRPLPPPQGYYVTRQHAAPTLPGMLDAATGLTRLVLQSVVLSGAPEQQLAALAALPDLQHLSLDLACQAQWCYEQREPSPLLPDSFLAQLSQLLKLTCLCLSSTGQQLLSSTGTQQLSSLIRLQKLCLKQQTDYYVSPSRPLLCADAATALQELTALTHLQLLGVRAQHIPDLQRCSMLRHVELRDFSNWGPETLAGQTGLQHLALSCWGAHDSMHLVSFLQQQKQLTSLQVTMPALQMERAGLAAFTASTKLQQLRLSHIQLQAAGWRHAFVPDRQLQQLTLLHLSVHNTAELSAVDLQALVQACPALQQLHLHFAQSYGSEPWPDLQPALLADSRHLTQLSVSGVEDVHLPQLLQLTQLLDLRLLNCMLSFIKLQELTALQQLTSLHVDLHHTQERVHCKYFGPHTCFQRKGEDSQPVWCQLQDQWDCANAAWQEVEQRREERQYGQLRRMGIPKEGFPVGAHGRSLRSSRHAKQQQMRIDVQSGVAC